MALAPRINDYGDFLFKEFHPVKSGYITASGEDFTYSSERAYEQHACGRHGYTKNHPLEDLLGVKSYRLPASYRRFVWKAEPLDGTSKGYGHDGTTYIESGIPGNFTLNHAWSPSMASRIIHYDNPIVQESLNRARIEALMRLGDMKLNVMVSLAEAVKSFDMISDRAIKIASALRSIRRGNFKLAAKHLGLTSTKGLSQNYLEFNYGWKPLVSDIVGGVQLLNQQLNPVHIVSGRRTIFADKTYQPDGYGYEGRIYNKMRATCCISGVLDDKYERITSQSGINNPLLLGWELIPYSFVTDWILPVGDYLQAMQAPAGLRFLSGWESVTVETNARLIKPRPIGWSVERPWGFEVSGFTFQRVKLETWPKPLPTYVKSPFSTKNGLNAIALIRNLF